MIFAGLVGLYLLAIKRVWEGRSEYDPSDPPAWWPFSLPLWRGVARAFPVQGACAILVIGGGIGADLAGKDSPGYDIGMSIGSSASSASSCSRFRSRSTTARASSSRRTSAASPGRSRSGARARRAGR